MESGRAFWLKRAHGRARLQQLFRGFPSRLCLHRRPQGIARPRPERPLRLLRRLATHRRGRARFGDLLGDRPRRLSVHRPTARAGLADRRCQSKSCLFKHCRVFFRRLSRRSRPPRPRPSRGHNPRRSHRQFRFCALGLHRGLQGLAAGPHPPRDGPSPRAHARARALGRRFQLAQRQRLLFSLRPRGRTRRRPLHPARLHHPTDRQPRRGAAGAERRGRSNHEPLRGRLRVLVPLPT